MEAHTRRLKELFHHDVQYVIPSFQRPYVWEQEEQWDPLWEDIRNTAERYLEELESLDPEVKNREAIAEAEAGTHFMGALVLQQMPRPAAAVAAWSIIDGQQRMTTLQLCLQAASVALKELDFHETADRLGRLVINKYAKGRDRFKVWPASLDQTAFESVMTNPHQAPDGSKIVEAFEFFFTQVREWIGTAPSESAASARVHALETALLGLLELVAIDLGPSDDPYVIFETLNARGTPLIASDLIKNFILRTAERVGEDADALYERYWERLEHDWWRAEVRQGRLRRPRVDVFLNYWLVAERAEEVPSHEVFKSFRELVEGSEQKVADIVESIVAYASSFRSWEDIDPWTPIGTAMYRWRVLDAGVTTPLLLVLFHCLGEDEAELAASLQVLESYLVRRMLCRMTTKDYNRVFVELIARLKRSSERPSEAMAEFFASSDSESRVWPDDATLRRCLDQLPLYRMLTRGRLRMVLEAIEDSLRSPRTEDEFVTRGKLTIEHILPQHWRQHWPPVEAKESDVAEREAERDRLLHTIGNLTLVAKRMNPSLSNGAWSEKKKKLNEHGVLLMNSRLLELWDSEWFLEDQIHERSHWMADLAIEIWPRETGRERELL